ncbi:uncharacterized protein L201_000747 [Kwoniella dendrophila CBS 6074]|uniref:VASt domain-containing protein n=1 Tax=Kwoniella dendrophila CBS 6074 TaxID=1295534 RepID=A0AAX4JMX1_9TREE
MPSILSRFKRSPSTSSNTSETDFIADNNNQRGSNDSKRRVSVFSSTSNNQSEGEDHILVTKNNNNNNTGSPTTAPGPGGSLFVENFNSSSQSINNGSPVKRSITPSPRNKHTPLNLPIPIPNSHSPNNKPLGTPKLVLTEEGSNSPRSFSSSPVVTSPTTHIRNRPNLGLGLTDSISRESFDEDDLETPTAYDQSFTSDISKMSLPVAGVPGNELSPRARSGSVLSANGGNGTGTRSRQGSILSSRDRVSIVSPPLSPNALQPVDSRNTSLSKKSRRNKKRTKSINSTSGQSGIAAALAKGGLHLPGPGTSDDIISTLKAKKRSLQKRSPFLTTKKDNNQDDDDDALNGEDFDGDEGFDHDDFDDSESDSDLDDDLPVTGFAVASNRRNTDFHALFPSIDEGDYLIEDYGCALSKDILLQGRLYVSENHLCFHANILGWVTDVVVAFADIKTIEKKMTALVIPNAIQVSTGSAKYTFASLIARDSTYDVMMNIWRLCNPNAVMSSVSLGNTNNQSSRPGSVVGDDADTAVAGGASGGAAGGASKGHGPTQCACGKEGKHYNETALQTTFHSTPEKIYELMFNSGWFKNFLSENQKLRDIESSEWKPISPSNTLLTRSTSYIKPLNGSIGPKQTKCHITDEHEHLVFDDYISLITTTRTPDVPSGGVFSVKTRTCLMWAGRNSTKVIVTTTVEWTGKSWVKGIIEKSAIEGQKTYHDDLEKGMREYIKEHPSEFVGEGGVDEGELEAAEEVAQEEKEQTEAQAYANENTPRQKRREEDMGYLQSSIDMFVNGLKSIFGGIKGIFDSLEDLLQDTPLNIKNLMFLLIILLIISNIYTYAKIDKNQVVNRRNQKLSHNRRNQIDYLDNNEENVEDIVKRILQQNLHQYDRNSPKDELNELMTMINNVESRLNNLKSSITNLEVEM